MKGHKLLYGASVLMVLGFCISVIAGWFKYNNTLNSAPFWVWILTDVLIWLIPAAIAAIAGFVAKKKLTKKENTK